MVIVPATSGVRMRLTRYRSASRRSVVGASAPRNSTVVRSAGNRSLHPPSCEGASEGDSTTSKPSATAVTARIASPPGWVLGWNSSRKIRQRRRPRRATGFFEQHPSVGDLVHAMAIHQIPDLDNLIVDDRHRAARTLHDPLNQH